MAVTQSGRIRHINKTHCAKEFFVKNITAVIMGGGRGTRLFPLTYERAKPSVSFAGKYRLIDIPISNCINSGIKRVFVLTQFLSASLHRHIMQTYHFDSFSDGFIDVLAAEQTPQGADWFQGTADAVRATLKHTTYYKTDHILILSGDHLYRMNYEELIKQHHNSRADITVCVNPVSRTEASEMGLLKVDPSGTVNEFVEKPKDMKVIDTFKAPGSLFQSQKKTTVSDRCLASMGVYVFKPAVLEKVLADREKTDFGKEIIPFSIDKYKVVAYPFTGYWKDIGTIDAFFEANIALAQAKPPFRLYEPNWPIYTHERSLPPSRVIHSEIRDSLLVEGSDIDGAHIEDSIIGVRSIVRKNTHLKEVVMMGADFYDGEQILGGRRHASKSTPQLGIGKNCMIRRAIIDKNARIGDDVIIRSKEGLKDKKGNKYWVKDGITIIPKGSIIPSGTVI